MTENQLWLSWDTYNTNICKGLGLLQQKGEFVDMTIAADGHHVKVHQMVLALVSPFIKDLISSAQCPHPIIFLNRVSYQTLESILEYAYTGEVLITQDSLPEFLEACKALHIKGLEKQFQTPDGALLEGTRNLNKPHTIPTQREERTQPTQTEIQTKDGSEGSIEADNNGPVLEYDSINEIEEVTVESQMDESAFEEEITDYEKLVSDQQTRQERKEKYKQAAVPKVQYTLSCQGSIQLVLNRYIYQMRHIRRNNQRMWRCINYNKNLCSAFAITVGDRVLQRGKIHNHPYHDKQILKRVQSGNMYTALNAIEHVSNKKLLRTSKSVFLDVDEA